ncbi:MAG: iron-containing alcohol dehydrogenase [Thermoleophilia bacterium]|nr:iron-containing alcohol dehydrogenase [Thermoleophilia bacterium]
MNPLFAPDPLRPFGIKQTIYQGSGCVEKIPEILKAEGWKRVMLVIGPRLLETETGPRFEELLRQSGVDHCVFSKIEPDPLAADIEQVGIPMAREFEVDVLLAVGGGSTMDSAKGIAVVGRSDHTIKELMGDLANINPFVPLPHETYPMIAVPTTFGTGSEVIRNAVISDSDGHKMVPMHDCILPAYAVCDPDLAATLPPRAAAAAAMDALVQAAEAYVSLAANDFSETMSLRAIELIGPHIVPYYHDRSVLEHADALCKGSMYAGIAWNNSFVAQIHASNHPITELLHIPHGEACAILFPPFVEYNGEACREKFRKVHNLMYPDSLLGSEAFEPGILVQKLVRLNRDLNIMDGKSMADYGGTEELVDRMVAEFPEDLYTYPRKTTKEDLRDMYLRVMRGEYL